MKIRVLFFVALCFLSINLFAQEPGFLDFRGRIYNPEGIPQADASIILESDGKIIQEVKTDKHGRFEFMLKFDPIYEITINYFKCVEMHMIVNTSGVDEKKKNKILPVYEAHVPLIAVNPELKDLKEFQKPFSLVSYDGKSGFMDDLELKQKFESGVYVIEQERLERERIKELQEKTKPISIPEKNIVIVGNLLLGELADNFLANHKLKLVDDEGHIIATTETNVFGTFVFHKLPSDQNLTLMSAEEDDANSLIKGTSITLTNRYNEEIIRSVSSENGNFNFRIEHGTPTFEEMQVDFSQKKVKGYLKYGEQKNTINGKIINIINDEGKVIESVVTNEKGSFIFNKLPSDGGFKLELAEEDDDLLAIANTTIYILNENGKIISSTRSSAEGKFTFKVLAGDNFVLDLLTEEDGSNLKLNLKGKVYGPTNGSYEAFNNCRIFLKDLKGEVINSIVLDENGDFNFNGLSVNKDFILELDPADPRLMNTDQLLLLDEDKNVIKSARKNKENKFVFTLLPGDAAYMSEMYLDDPWLSVDKTKKDLTIAEKVNFASNDTKLLAESYKILSKVLTVMKVNPSIKLEIHSHSDSRGSDDYNLALSEKRAQSAVNYLVEKGIDTSRLIGKGYGETQLINDCGNNSDCSEEEHARNRRVEFKIIQN